MTESAPTEEPISSAPTQEPTSVDEAIHRSASRSGPFRFIAVVLTGILIVLAGMLYVMIENQAVMIENQNKSLEHQWAKEWACENDGGEISWNTRGDQICDLRPYARGEDGMFDFDIDWVIR